MAVREDALNERCETCGFDRTQLSPADIATAARSLGRRWRELFDRAQADDGAHRLHRHLPSGWSVVGHGGHVVDVLERKAVALAAVRERHRPTKRGRAAGPQPCTWPLVEVTQEPLRLAGLTDADGDCAGPVAGQRSE